MLKIKIDEFNAELANFESAIKEFKPYTENFITKTKNKFNGQSSDFIDGMECLLNCMSDTKAPELLEKAENLYKIAKGTIDNFLELDKNIAKKISKSDNEK